MKSFELTAKQQEANRFLGGPATHKLLYGGSRSGKTFLIVRAYVVRALRYERSRQAMFRYRFNACRSSIVADTLPKVMELCFPKIAWKLDKTEWIARFPNGSEIWFGGLDEKDRTEKILGQEYCGIFLSECSQIPWSSRNVALTRLAQNCGARLRMDYDCNPPKQSHWTYQIFIAHKDPETRQPLPDPENYAAMRMNPGDNMANLTPEYIAELERLPERLRRRFLEGEFLSDTENALWSQDAIDRSRIVDTPVPDMQRVVVGVDPSGADEETPERDAIGICVVGLGTDGKAYVLEDLTLRGSPATWGNVVAQAYERHAADVVVGEENYGGAMVRHVIQTARPSTPYKAVTATRGKVVRAEPIAALYEQGRVHHVGFFPELEDELCDFTTTGYAGERSPNRADALIWALSELFPGMTREHSRRANLLPPEQLASWAS
ncbi:MAG: DNA packaging protein [Alphaproteobacteria bacterium]|nr:MAG: DNA packaging protein [Alphaproteobacteria bacterium]